MTSIDPATPGHPDPATEHADAWAGIRGRSQALTQHVDRAIELAAEEWGGKRPGRLTRWRGQRAASRADARVAARLAQQRRNERKAPPADHPAAPAASRLRFIPPAAALGTAFVLQVVVMTDVVGGKVTASLATSPVPYLAERPWFGYLAGVLLGLAVASCAEGGAAYLMDLYDKHLRAKDSTGMLRLAMVAYVAASAAVIHWWTAAHDFPSLIAWVLAAMTGSALFLYSRGSRWRHRAAMRESGHLDPAMPRLPLAAKLLHPYRWAVTLYLTSWEPASSPDEARARFKQWSDSRTAKRLADTTAKKRRPAAPRRPGRRAPRIRYIRPTSSAPAGRSGHGPTALADAAFLRKTYGDTPPGRNQLYRELGGNKERWTQALRAHRVRADQPAA
ncbi:hypothetical protein [Winogradskya humida]|nr:hypothetical protein [Actinoplanes humidus]